MTDFIRVLNMMGNDSIKLNIEDVYNFRKLNREIYNKGELIGDLCGNLLKVRDIRNIDKISVDLKSYNVTLEDVDDNKINTALNDINSVLKGFLKRFSYLSNLSYDDADKYEYYLNIYPLFDVVKCGNSIIVTM